MKARYQYRFYPTDQQRQSLAQLFGCIRVVWNDALGLCRQSEKLPSNNDLQKLVITQAKKTVEREWLSGVSNIPLQMSNGEKAESPDYSRAYRKIRKLQRKLARQPKDSKRREKTRIQIAKLHNKIADTRKDFLHKLSTKVVSENQAIVLEDLNISGMLKNRKLSRAISLQGWREFRTLCEAKSQKFGRVFHVISRWEPTSQVCSECGYKWGKLDLKVRSVECLNCGTKHDRDENAAKNINKVGIGHCHDSKRAQRQSKTTTVASVSEASRITVRDGR